MERRQFLKFGAAGIASASIGLPPMDALAQSVCQVSGGPTPVPQAP
ncbi:twin-arginine translocation signal domain-containing protein [Microvirga sp. VF16]|nr:twin-arginine translocation signal domain-containing protein [Microvirga sp. VF16]